jgi:hypothetical protein
LDLKLALLRLSDLGTRYNDLRLNQRVLDQRGQPLNVFGDSEESGVLTFRCNLCAVSVQGKRNIDSHIEGKKHLARIDCYVAMDPIEPTPPGEEQSATPAEPIVMRLLNAFHDAPVIGAEFVVEIVRGRDLPPAYHCALCDTNFDASGLVSDLISAKHRLEYLRSYFPIASKMFSKVPNTNVWERPTFDFLESVAMRIEEKGGRMVPKVVAGEDVFRTRYQDIKDDIEDGNHVSESDELNFANLPDPFGSYLYKIDPSEINPDQSAVKKQGPY